MLVVVLAKDPLGMSRMLGCTASFRGPEDALLAACEVDEGLALVRLVGAA